MTRSDAPPVTLPDHLAAPAPEREDAVLAAVRGHMEYLGPATSASVAAMLAVGEGEVTSAMPGSRARALCCAGRFTPGSDAEEWSDRRLLARIHRPRPSTALRSEIEPVSAQDFMRFLFVAARAGKRRLEGKRGVLEAISRNYQVRDRGGGMGPTFLPAARAQLRTRAGSTSYASRRGRRGRGWGSEENGNGRGASPQRDAVTLALRRDWAMLLQSVRGAEQPEDPVSGAAAATLDALRQHGALFFDDLAAASRQLPCSSKRRCGTSSRAGLVTATASSRCARS